VGQQLIEARFAAPGGGGVAWWAHITGFLFGAALATAVKLLRLEERREARALRGGTDRLIESAQRARAQGDLEAAREFLRRLLAARPNDVTAWREAVELGFASGDMAEITRAATRLLELQAPDADPAAVLELLEDTRWSELPARSSRLSMAIARFFEKRGEKERALEHYEDVIQAAGQDVMGLRALIRKGELLIQAGRRHAARESLMLARSHPACHGVSAESVDRTLGELESRRLPADRAPDRPS
jgi:tetratricopeptide (TPR) repeat protein